MESIDKLLPKLCPGADEETIRERRQGVIETASKLGGNLDDNLELAASILQMSLVLKPVIGCMKSGAICLPNEVWLSENGRDLHEALPAELAEFNENKSSILSVYIFDSLRNARPDHQLNWTKLKRLYITRIEASRLPQLLQEANNLKRLAIIVLEFNDESTTLKLANLLQFNVRKLKGSGKIKFETPKLTHCGWEDPAFSDAIELVFPQQLRVLRVEKYEPSMKQFKNLERLMCARGLPDGMLSTFCNLKKLDYPLSNDEKDDEDADLSLPHEFLPRKKTILSILREKKRLERTDLVIVFYGIQLDNERQLSDSENFTDFLVNNFNRVTEDPLWSKYGLYNPPASLPSGMLHLIHAVKITKAVDDPRNLGQFLASLENLISLTTIDVTLDSNFYQNLADVTEISELKIVHTGKPPNENRMNLMADFKFLLAFDDLRKFHTDLPVSLKTIEMLLKKFTQEFSIRCEFNKQKGVSVRRVGEWFGFVAEKKQGVFHALHDLIKRLAKI